jgi:hypothetical protein
LKEVLGFYSRKFDDGSIMMVARSLTFFDDADTDPDPVLFDDNLHWNTVKDFFLKTIRKEFR